MTDPDAPVPTPLEMARNCVASVQAAADYQASDDPRQQLLAHIYHVGEQGDQASKVAARMSLVSIAEHLDAQDAQPAHLHTWTILRAQPAPPPVMMLGKPRPYTTVLILCSGCGEPDTRTLPGEWALADLQPGAAEKITRDDDWLHCLCGNTPDQSGFSACSPDGTEVEPVGPPVWDGLLYVCLDCGRIINQETLEVRGRRGSVRGDPDGNAIEAYCAVPAGDGDENHLLQYAVDIPGTGIKAYGDQSWVKGGMAAAEMGGLTMVRDIRISYGLWRRAPGPAHPPRK